MRDWVDFPAGGWAARPGRRHTHPATIRAARAIRHMGDVLGGGDRLRAVYPRASTGATAHPFTGAVADSGEPAAGVAGCRETRGLTAPGSPGLTSPVRPD